LAGPATIPKSFLGMCRGRILTEPQGTGGFGYDPVFFSVDLNKPFSEVTLEEKNRVSHRAEAVRAMTDWLLQHPTFDVQRSTFKY
jgi:XTP/dITP diphosphohydrolase